MEFRNIFEKLFMGPVYRWVTVGKGVIRGICLFGSWDNEGKRKLK